MYLREHGAEVEVTDDPDRRRFQAEHGVPAGAGSCHTALVGGYVVEGHVPVGAVQQLLAERPDAVGLTLPGMPPDSPGMGGDTGSWETQPVMLIRPDGTMAPFIY